MARVFLVVALVVSLGLVGISSVGYRAPGDEGVANASAYTSAVAHPDGSTSGTPREAMIRSAPIPLGTPTIISPNGTVSNGSAPIRVTGNVYQLTASFTGSILDERSGSSIDGAGFTITQAVGTSAALEALNASEIAVRNLTLAETTAGIALYDVVGATVAGDRIGGAGWALEIFDSTDLNVTGNSAENTEGTYAYRVSNLNLSGDDLRGSTNESIEVLGGTEVRVIDNLLSGSAVGADIESSQGVLLHGNNLSSTPSGLYEYDVTSSNITSNNVSSTGTGIFLLGCALISGGSNMGLGGTVGLRVDSSFNASFESEDFTGFATGALLSQDLNVSIEGSSFRHSQDALQVSGSATVQLIGDNVSGFGLIGVSVVSSSQVLIEYDTAEQATNASATAFVTASDQGVQVVQNAATGVPSCLNDTGSSSVTFSANICSHSNGSSAVTLQADVDVQMVHDQLDNSSGGGIAAFGTKGLSVVFNNLNHDLGNAVVLVSVVGATLENNTANSGGTSGFTVLDSSDLTLTGNQADSERAGAGTGFSIVSATGATVGSNTATNCNLSVDIENSTDVQLVGNNVSGSSIALKLVADLNSTAAGNYVFHASVAFWVKSNTGLWIYHNDFADDAGWVNVASRQSIHWDALYPEGGNFWANHTSPDNRSGPNQTWLGSDGIVDTPVVVNATNVDHFPLTTPYFGFYITVGETGLTAFTPWSFEYNGIRVSTIFSSIVLPMANGPGATYQIRVLPLHGYMALLPSAGPYVEPRANVTVTFQFVAYLFPVTIQEYGLPLGTQWQIVIGPLLLGSVTNSIVTSVANGSYNYLAGKVAGFQTSVGGGVVYMTGIPASVIIVYTPLPNPGAGGGGVSSTTIVAVGAGAIVGVFAAWLVFGPLERKRRGKGPSGAVTRPAIPPGPSDPGQGT